MRALDGGGDLHPELRKVLAELERKGGLRAAPGGPRGSGRADSAPGGGAWLEAGFTPAPRRMTEISSPDLDRTSRICGSCRRPQRERRQVLQALRRSSLETGNKISGPAGSAAGPPSSREIGQ